MPAGERCRRAVCGRTACTVRCGGGRHPGPVGKAVRSPDASRQRYIARISPTIGRPPSSERPVLATRLDVASTRAVAAPPAVALPVSDKSGSRERRLRAVAARAEEPLADRRSCMTSKRPELSLLWAIRRSFLSIRRVAKVRLDRRRRAAEASGRGERRFGRSRGPRPRGRGAPGQRGGGDRAQRSHAAGPLHDMLSRYRLERGVSRAQPSGQRVAPRLADQRHRRALAA